MKTEDNRRHKRIDSLNLSYICVDKNDVLIRQSMGRTLNVSESGICLETYFDIDASNFLTMTIALEDILVDIRGKVIYCHSTQDDRFKTGVEFIDLNQSSRAVLQKFIKLFQEGEIADN